MTEIKKVLACVDFSDYSMMTMEKAVEVVKGLPAEIILLNIINNRDLDAIKVVSPYFPGTFTIESFIEKTSNERRGKILEMIDQFFPDEKQRMRIVIRVGVPYEAILKAIDEEKIDLVVLASKGRSNLIGTLHGSNAEKVFRHSPVPVLSVRSRESFSRKR